MFPYFRQRIFCGGLVLVIIDRDSYALLREFQGNTAPNAARTARDQSVLSTNFRWTSRSLLLDGREFCNGCKGLSTFV